MRSFLVRHCPSRAMIVAVFAVFLAATSSDAFAGAANFLLNTRNITSATTTLRAGKPVAGKALQLTNTNTTTGATALGLTVASGHPPFTVNPAAGKVANLNADLLDGHDSSAFLGRTEIIAASRTIPNESIVTDFVVCPGGWEAISGGAFTDTGMNVVESYPGIAGVAPADGTNGPANLWYTTVSTLAPGVLVHWYAVCAQEG